MFVEYPATLCEECVWFWKYRPRTGTTWTVLLARYAVLLSAVLQLLLLGGESELASETVALLEPCAGHLLLLAVGVDGGHEARVERSHADAPLSSR